MAFRAREIVLPAVGRDLQVAESEVPEPRGGTRSSSGRACPGYASGTY